MSAWRDVCDNRMAVEVGVAVLAAERAAPAALDALDELVRAIDGMLESFPAYRQADIRLHVGLAEATCSPRLVTAMTEVQGEMSGLIALIDATGLAALVAAADDEHQFDGVTPLGATARLEFLAPARGRLRGRCELQADALSALRPVLEGTERKATLDTEVHVLNADDTVVCRGSFTWKLRRA